MVFEIEAKYRVPDLSGLACRLVSSGWTELSGSPIEEEDLYFQGIDRDFRQTGEALRVRVQNGVPRFTFKGAASLSEHGVKVRRELELELPEALASEAYGFLEALGFRRIALVRKARRIFTHGKKWPGVVVTLDQVRDLGSFAEIEVLLKGGESGVTDAALQVAEIAGKLCLQHREDRSYLRMLLGIT